MKKTIDVASTTSHILVANLAKSATLLLFFIFVSRILGDDELGVYSLALAITTPFFALALMGARIARVTGPLKITDSKFALALMITGLSATFLSLLMSSTLFPGAITAVLWVSLFKWSDIYTELYAGSIQQRRRTKILAPASLAGTIFITGLSVSALYLSQNLSFALIIFASSGWIYAVFYKAIAQQRKSSIDDSGTLTDVFRIGLPLGLAGAIAALGSTVPQYEVALTLGESAVGVLAVYLYVYALADIFGAAYGQAWISRFQELGWEEQNKTFIIKVAILSSAVIFPITTVGLVLFNCIGPLIFGNYFALKFPEAVALLIGITLLPYVHIIATALFVRMHYKRSMLVMIMATAVTIIFTLVLVPNFGITGGIYAIVAGLIARGLSSTFLVITAKA